MQQPQEEEPSPQDEQQQQQVPPKRRTLVATAVQDDKTSNRLRAHAVREEKKKAELDAAKSEFDVVKEERKRQAALRKADLERKRVELYAWNRQLKAAIDAQQVVQQEGGLEQDGNAV